MMKPLNSLHSHSRLITQEGDKLPRGVMHRVTPTPPGPHTPGSPALAVWGAVRTRCQAAPLTTGAVSQPVLWEATPKPRWRISRGCTRSTTTRSGETGWTSFSGLWRTEEHPSHSVPPSARTLWTCTSSTCSLRTGAAFWSARTRRPGRTLRRSSELDLPHRELTH